VETTNMSRSDTTHAHATKSVPFNQIFIDPKINSRKKLKDIPELAKNIDQNGLLIPLLVTNGGDDSHPYTLVGGFRRGEALGPKHLDWGKRPVNVIVVDNAQGSNLIENVLRAPLPALDLAERLAEMKAGTYHDPSVKEGEELKKYTTAELAALLSKTASHIANLIRVHESITDDVRKVVSLWDPPARLLFVWAGKPEGKQLELAQEWAKYMEQLEKGGRRRQVKGAGNKASSTSSKPSKADLDDRWNQLTWKAENKKGKAAEIAAAAAEVLRFVLGEIKTFPTDVLSGDDVREYRAAVKAEEKAAKEAEAEEEDEAAEE